MESFFSRQINPVDSKGRVSLPSPFRESLARDGQPRLLALPSLDFPALDCGGGGLLASIEKIIDRFPEGSLRRDQAEIVLYGSLETLHLDKEGRFVLTDQIRRVLGNPDRIAFVGVRSRFQMWRPEVHDEQIPLYAAELKASRGTGVPSPGTVAQ